MDVRAMRLERQNCENFANRCIARIQADNYFQLTFRPLRSPPQLSWSNQMLYDPRGTVR